MKFKSFKILINILKKGIKLPMTSKQLLLLLTTVVDKLKH